MRGGSRLGALWPATLALGLGCAASAPAAPSSSSEPAELATCVLADGAVRLGLPQPPGFALARTPEACMVAREEGAVPWFYTVSAFPESDEGPYALLDEPDGALRWVRESELFEAPPRRTGRGELRIAGRSVRTFTLVGRPAGLGRAREALLARVRVPGHHIVVLAIYHAGDTGERRAAREMVRGIRIEEAP